MKKYLILLSVLLTTSASAQDVGGIVSAGNALVDVAKDTRNKIDRPVQVIELPGSWQIHVFADSRAYIVNLAGSRKPVTDGTYTDISGKTYRFADGYLK